MKIVYEYSHLGGSEILIVRYPEIIREIYDVIHKVEPDRSKLSKEKTKSGRMLYSPINLNKAFKKNFNQLGYREIRDSYKIEMPNYSTQISGAYRQVNFVKEKVLVEVQFGKYAFMFYDMAKFQYFINENMADVGIEIVPSHALHKEMSSGASYGEQLVYDIERLKRNFPAVPVEIILIDTDIEI